MTDADDTQALAEQIATSVRGQLEDEGSSRRSFLSRSALAGGALLALGGGTGIALAQEGESGDDAGGEMMASFDDVEGTDIDVLNYALTLEHLEDVFYRQALETFSEEDFVGAGALEAFPEEQRRSAYGYVETVAEHEATHVEVLTQAVELLGGQPAQEASYDFGVESVSDFLALGQVFEKTGVAAYAGAAGFIESPDLLGVALSIHSVEANHAAYLSLLNGESPVPNAFNPASSQAEVLDAVSPFIVSGDGNGTGTGTQTATPTGNATQTPHGTGTPAGNATQTPTDSGNGSE